MSDEKRVREMFEEMANEGVKPVVANYSSLVTVLNKFKKTEAVLEIYKKVKSDKTLRIDNRFYSFVINGCVFNKKLENAIEILLESVSEEIKLHEETYNNVLEYLIKNTFMKHYERVNHCTTICKALKEKNYQINIDLYNRLMKLIYQPSENKGKKPINKK